MKAQKFALVAVVCALAAVLSGCNRLKARDHLNKGVSAFRNTQYQQAIVHFKTAVDLDPQLLNARLYLATAYRQQYIPGGDSPDNVQVGKQAIASFEDVLKMDPKNETAIASIAQTYYDMKDFDKAKDYQRRRLQVEPNNPEPYYWIGVIDWATAYPRAQKVRNDLNIALPADPTKPDILPPIPDKQRAQLEQENTQVVEEGLEAVQKAIDLKPNEVNAMTYMNLLLRQKSEYAQDAQSRADLINQANDWIEKAVNIKKQAAAQASAGAK